eukprot:CAMPEP_0113694058 /NCGR_PEP_ID=MMETSP0038_2-20120614/20048_1 /TAXON_ID=2898 /ORGANISM="Cryptomonas paramecium" /LENGTH=38 /DNA_ID=CAMNT_0000616277 /DNA_START=58 /DNA_END=174 /DNA_ORIENTATION=+ /assembly_acc=CAM_ASM_000170
MTTICCWCWRTCTQKEAMEARAEGCLLSTLATSPADSV